MARTFGWLEGVSDPLTVDEMLASHEDCITWARFWRTWRRSLEHTARARSHHFSEARGYEPIIKAARRCLRGKGHH